MKLVALVIVQIITVLIGGTSLFGLNSTSFAVARDDFRIRTAADFVKLCATAPSDADYAAAISFCHGYASGAYRYYQLAVEHSPEDRFICIPEPAPARSEAIADFLVWSKSHPERMKDPAVDAIFQYLGLKYPCDGE